MPIYNRNPLIVHMTLLVEGSLSDTCTDRGDQDSITDIHVWCNGQFFACNREAGVENRWIKRVLQGIRDDCDARGNVLLPMLLRQRLTDRWCRCRYHLRLCNFRCTKFSSIGSHTSYITNRPLYVLMKLRYVGAQLGGLPPHLRHLWTC